MTLMLTILGLASLAFILYEPLGVILFEFIIVLSLPVLLASAIYRVVRNHIERINQYKTINDLPSDDDLFDEDEDINPSTGLPMMTAIKDIHGNKWGR